MMKKSSTVCLLVVLCLLMVSVANAIPITVTIKPGLTVKLTCTQSGLTGNYRYSLEINDTRTAGPNIQAIHLTNPPTSPQLQFTSYCDLTGWEANTVLNANTGAVTELFFVGWQNNDFANSIPFGSGLITTSPGSNDTELFGFYGHLYTNANFANSMIVVDYEDGTKSAAIAVVPEPITLALLSFGGLLLRHKK